MNKRNITTVYKPRVVVNTTAPKIDGGIDIFIDSGKIKVLTSKLIDTFECGEITPKTSTE